MHVAVCIVGYRNVGDIVACVAAIEASTHRDLSVTVCENGGEQAAADLRAALPAVLSGGGTVRVLPPRGNLGYAGGFNACVAATRDADAWWLVNPDAEPHPSCLERMLDRLNDGDCDLVGGTLQLPDGRVQGHGGRFRHWLARAESIGHGSAVDQLPDPAAVEAAMNYVLGASMLAGRRYMQTVGPMREEYFLYAEEIEWCLRGQAAGMRLGFAPGALIGHAQGGTTGSGHDVTARPWLPIYLDERNKLHVVRDTKPAALPVAVVSAFALILLRYARRGAWTQTGHAISGWWAGLRNRRGMPERLRTGG